MPRFPFVKLAVALATGLALAAATPAVAATPSLQSLTDGSRLALDRIVKARSGRVVDDHVLVRRVRKVANGLNARAVKVDAQAYKFNWQTYGIVDPAPDLLMFPDGRLLFTDGLALSTGFADDELAAVIAQQLAHILLGHVDARLRIDVADLESPDPNRRAVAVAEQLPAVLERPEYTGEEIEAADRLAIELMARSGFDPRAASSAWRRLDRMRSPIVARQKLSEQRLATIDALAREAIPLFEDAKRKVATKPSTIKPPPPVMNKPWATPGRS